ncbi:uncharacterized protein LOC114728300 isoform X2 [Neltuma alba]|uniref:uncharacterized protein LOC114728300 isoform X2 n=1 Tax=Neltuma alba TaxID=207710 RepID=UPI0010A35322|nr:uncharacterized protein LOC114728300 isoform X2 [Prosopis alba]
MSAATSISSPGSPYLGHLSSSSKTTCSVLCGPTPSCRTFSSVSHSLNHRFLRLTSRSFARTSTFHGFRRFSPVMEWQDCTVKMEVDVPASAAYNFYSDREAIPRWMPFISSVTVLPDKPDLSRWSLKYKAFGRDIEYSWLARNMQPIPNQKIHWRSLEGLPNSTSQNKRHGTYKAGKKVSVAQISLS